MTINFDDFKKVELKTAKIIEATRIEKSDKLLKLKVEIGEETRQVLAGIGKVYTPEEVVGKTIITVVNLEPRELMGERSEAMLLAASDGNGPILLTTDQEVSSGLSVG